MPITKDHILQEAAKALVTKPDSSLTDIAQSIGIGRTTLHRHFAKRDDLIRALALYSLKLVDDAMQPIKDQNLPPSDALYAALDVLITIGDHFHFLSREYRVMSDTEISQIYNRQLEELSTLIQLLQEENIIASDVPIAWVVQLIDSMIYTAWEAIEAGDIARNSATDLVFRTIMSGVGS